MEPQKAGKTTQSESSREGQPACYILGLDNQLVIPCGPLPSQLRLHDERVATSQHGHPPRPARCPLVCQAPIWPDCALSPPSHCPSRHFWSFPPRPACLFTGAEKLSGVGDNGMATFQIAAWGREFMYVYLGGQSCMVMDTVLGIPSPRPLALPAVRHKKPAIIPISQSSELNTSVFARSLTT